LFGESRQAGENDVRDLSSLSPAAARLSYELGTVTGRQDFLHAAAQTLLSLIDGDVVGWNSIDVAAGQVEVVTFPEDVLDSKTATDRLRDTTDDNPTIASYLRAGADMRPRRLSDVCTHSELIKTRTYAEIAQMPRRGCI
jgi:hypothetical protein